MRTARLIGAAVLAISALLVVPTAQVAAAGNVVSSSAPATPSTPTSMALPAIRITTARSGIAPGVLFANPHPARAKNASWTGGPMIYDNAGHVIWFMPNPKVHVTLPVTYKGQPALAYHLTTGFVGGWSVGHWVVLNQSYQQIGTIGNGVDHHELLLVDNGTMAYVDSYHSVKYDLSKFGGPVNGTVVEPVIQEINLASGNVVWEWHGLPHVPVAETYRSLQDKSVDYFHLNSIAVDTDGNLIVSGRHISAVLKINRSSGAVMWQLGGKRSSFRFTGGTGPSFQHDARVVGPNTYSVFDNGVSRKPPYSRGVIFQVDPAQHTARVIAEWRHQPDIFSKIEGSNRELPNGNRLIGWATAGVATEYAGHTVVWESKIEGAQSYRTLRSPWNGTPRNPPTLVIHRDGSAVSASAAWNGATGVTHWELLGGPDARHLRLLRTVPYTGFQMSQTMSVSANERVFAVRAVRAGSASSQSAVVAVP
jgi:hypothetical protein